MEQWLQSMIVGNTVTMMLVFCRLGTVFVMFPGIGDSFTPPNVRLLLALSFSVMMTGPLQHYFPDKITPSLMLKLIVMEIIVGALLATVIRLLLAALETAGAIISMNTGLSTAQMFNPSISATSTLPSVMLSITGTLLIFATDMHQFILEGMVNSYQVFKPGEILQPNDMLETVATAVARSFAIGVQISAPFLAVGIMINAVMGVASKLMPQVQIFFIALPAQLILGLTLMALTGVVMMRAWMGTLQESFTFITGQ
ncbi:MAG: flagellar biosynthetic protein FliR [Alphaproteobacteria bacterium]